MKDKALKNFLNSFGRKVTKQAKNNLSTAGKVVTGNLLNSIKYRVRTTPKGYRIEFYSAAYGDFVDKGVSGTEVTRSFKDYKGKTLKSPFGYRKAKGHSQPPTKALDKWIVKKGIAPRDKEGKFMSRKSIKFAIARSIGKKGIQGISFFQKPLMLGMKEFGGKFGAAIKDDIVNSLRQQKIA